MGSSPAPQQRFGPPRTSGWVVLSASHTSAGGCVPPSGAQRCSAPVLLLTSLPGVGLVQVGAAALSHGSVLVPRGAEGAAGGIRQQALPGAGEGREEPEEGRADPGPHRGLESCHGPGHRLLRCPRGVHCWLVGARGLR